MNRERLQKLMATLGFSFRQPEVLAEALVHSSYANEHPKRHITHNERLEFLGDAVLDLVVSDWLFRTTPNLNEGTMTKARSSIVCERSLAEAARRIGLADYLLLGCGERSGDFGVRSSILADAFEALVGAMYLDGGLPAVTCFVEKVLGENLFQARDGLIYEDYKTRLQEELQKEGSRTIVYELVFESGPAHAREFTVKVTVDGVDLGNGTGRTKKQAEQAAAKAALDSARQ